MRLPTSHPLGKDMQQAGLPGVVDFDISFGGVNVDVEMYYVEID